MAKGSVEGDNGGSKQQ